MADILIVDDEEDICDFLAQIAVEAGYKASYAVTGESAVEFAEQNEFKVCIVDLKLSTSMSGLDVIKAIRAIKPNVVIAAMSGYVDVGLKHDAERFGVSAYLEKPSDLKPEVFSEKLKGLMAKVKT